MGRNAEEIAAYDEVVSRFGTASEPTVREQVGWALWNKGVRFGQMGRSAEEIAAYDAVIARFGTASEPALRQQAAKALHHKTLSLRRMMQERGGDQSLMA
jgi:hypothetical protein